MKSILHVAFFGYPPDTKRAEVLLVLIIVLSREEPVSDLIRVWA